jgi:hypothetical protein
MAKKSKKPAKKAAKKSSKPAKKASKKAAKKQVMLDSLAPIPVSTGKGAPPVEIGTRLVKMFNEGRFTEIEDAFWDKKGIASIEGVGVNLAWVGLKAVRAKNEGWMSDNVIHGASAEGPFVGSTGFAVRFKMDVETKSTGQRRIMDEVGVYTVEDGKIVCEEFMYAVG